MFPGMNASSRLHTLAGAALLAAAALILHAPSQAAELLRIGGTGSALGGIQRVANVFSSRHPDIDLVILLSLGSGGGIKALIADTIELCVSARPTTAAERAAGLVEHEYARTPLVFATRSDTAADGVTLQQIVSIYRGDTNTWPDGGRLRLVMRPATETDTAFLRTLSPEMDKAIEIAIHRKDLSVAINDQDNAKALEDIRGSLGVISLGQLRSENRALKPLALDGMVGTIDTLRDGTYPHAKRLYALVGPRPPPAAVAFLTFLFSAEGSRLLTEVGYLPTAAAN
jgi:phosphate transport system substrate-binding protein